MTIEFLATPIADPPPVPTWEEVASRRHQAVDPGLAGALLAAGPLAETNRDRLLAGGALCVTTGQQPGLFLGPLFTIYKALSAIVLAAGLRRRLASPVVPVFWVAGDDHDFLEAGHAHVVSRTHELIRLALPDRPQDAPLTPLYREALGPGLADALQGLWESQPPSEFRPEVEAWLGRHYRSETSVAEAFAGALSELLGPHGLVVFRPTDVAAKRVMRPWLLRALEQAADLDVMLEARSRQLTAEGRAAPVPAGDGASLVMVEGAAGRDRLLVDGGAFQSRRARERFTLDELKALAADSPERLSPNVLLRPVIEAALLPSVAYVGGPGELAYFPQCDPVYQALAVSPQARVPRWSALLIEQRTRKVLDRYSLTPADFQLPEGTLEQRLVRGDLPQAADQALKRLRQTATEEYGRLREAAAAIDPTLRKSVDAARNAALAGTRDIEKRLLSHLKQRNDTLVQQVARTRQSLFPLGQAQERVIGPVPFLVRYGTAFLDQAHQAAAPWASALEASTDGP